MPRGRPRKNPAPVENKNISPATNDSSPSNKDSSDNNTIVPNEFNFLSPAQYNKLLSCDRCHVKILSGEKIVNLTYLTGVAPWHRQSSIDRVCLCSSCAKELNSIIDKWLLNDNKGVKPKCG